MLKSHVIRIGLEPLLSASSIQLFENGLVWRSQSDRQNALSLLDVFGPHYLHASCYTDSDALCRVNEDDSLLSLHQYPRWHVKVVGCLSTTIKTTLTPVGRLLFSK